VLAPAAIPTQLSSILLRPPVSVTGFVVAVVSSSVRSVGDPLRVALGLLEGLYGLFVLLLGYVSHAMLSKLFLRDLRNASKFENQVRKKTNKQMFFRTTVH
jgi:hypothetical protein